MKKLKELADDIVRIQQNLHAAHPEGYVKVHVEELAEVLGSLIAELSSSARAAAAQKKEKA